MAMTVSTEIGRAPRARQSQVPDRMRPQVIVVLIATVLLATGAMYFGSLRLFEAQAVSVARSQHALYLRSLNETINQHQHLPYVLARNPELASLTEQGAQDALNTTLRDFAESAGLEAIYVMDVTGTVIATSNYDARGSFLGQNYGFRPYFQAAITGLHSDYFAIGATTGRPGYFVAEPLYDGSGALLGVVAIKLDISELQTSWEDRGEAVLTTNEDGVVVLASDRGWLYRTVDALSETRRSEILESRQFGSLALAPLDWIQTEPGQVTVAGQPHFLISGATDLLDWQVHYLTSKAGVQRQTLMATAVLGSFLAVLIGFAAFLRSRRIETALELSQFHRRELMRANAQLIEAQEELARTSKLAALGQLAASVTHELGQPISALKNHLLAAELSNEITSPDTLANLTRLTARMEAITKELKFFARRSSAETARVDMGQVVEEALNLLRHDLEKAGVSTIWMPPQTPCLVMGNQMQLEQAMVNLIRNALLACEALDDAGIEITCQSTSGKVMLAVADEGPGLEGLPLHKLQEPFFSTRSSGEGMGLGLAITTEILAAHGGSLRAEDRPVRGAVFTIELPACSEDRA